MFTKSISMTANQIDLEKEKKNTIFFCIVWKIFQFDYMFVASWGETVHNEMKP